MRRLTASIRIGTMISVGVVNGCAGNGATNFAPHATSLSNGSINITFEVS